MNISDNKTLTLGEIIDKLEALPPTLSIRFNFCDFLPTTFDSWRYNFSELALGYKQGNLLESTVSKLLDLAKEAVDTSFQGYKGGDYIMTAQTSVWVANYGLSGGNTGILDIQAIDDEDCIIITGYCENSF